MALYSLKSRHQNTQSLVLQAFSVPRCEICGAGEFSGRESIGSNVINILGGTASTRGVVGGGRGEAAVLTDRLANAVYKEACLIMPDSVYLFHEHVSLDFPN